MFDPNANVSPVNPLPPVIVILALAIAVIELTLQLASAGFIGGPDGVGWRLELMRALGFFDNVFEYMRQTNTYDWNTLGRFITYPFVHFAFTHAAFAFVMILAIGKAVGDIFHTFSVLAIFFLSSITGALAFGLLADSQYPLIGAYPAIYGLIGAYTWTLWLNASADGESRLMAFRLIGLLMGLQLVYRYFFGGSEEWIADLTGFITGFLLSFVLAPDGRARINRWVVQIRKR